MTSVSAPSFALNPALDAGMLRERFRHNGRIRIEDFLAPDLARALADALAADQRWLLVINGTSSVFEIPRADYEAMPPDQRGPIDAAIFSAAARGFQFRYETIRVPDEDKARAESGTLLDQFARFMSSAETLSLLSSITGMEDIEFADAQATRYKAGDFLTRHDDNVAGKHRRLAYVMGLTEEWRPEWGGLLTFCDADGDVIETLVPRFNALSLFSVPQHHSVSYVAPSAPHARLSVTGWIRKHG